MWKSSDMPKMLRAQIAAHELHNIGRRTAGRNDVPKQSSHSLPLDNIARQQRDDEIDARLALMHPPASPRSAALQAAERLTPEAIQRRITQNR